MRRSSLPTGWAVNGRNVPDMNGVEIVLPGPDRDPHRAGVADANEPDRIPETVAPAFA